MFLCMGLAAPEAIALPRNRFFSSFTLAPGLVAAAAVAAVAWPLGRLVPEVGAPIFGLALGVALASAGGQAQALDRGLAFASRYVLQAAVVALGATLSLGRVASVGGGSVPVLLASLGAAFAAAYVGGRLLGVPPRLTALVGVGTGICGASAIAAVSGVVGAAEAEVAYAVTSLAPALHDPHSVEVKPGALAELRGAALLVRIGLDHEPWLARPLRAVGDPRLLPGGSATCSD